MAMHVQLRFVSNNEHKIREAQEILALSEVSVVPLSLRLDELQTEDTDRLVRDKTLKAFRTVGRALFVEHTGLYVSYLNGFPGGLTQIFWDRLQADRFTELFRDVTDRAVVARTVIGYTDGRYLRTFTGEIGGTIAEEPRGPRDFQWDCVFVPEGYSHTFAELGESKNEISMRRRALDDFSTFLRGARS